MPRKPPVPIEAKRPKVPRQVREYFAKIGVLGGEKRAEMLTAEQRRRIAKKGSRARWSKTRAQKAVA